MKNQTSKRAVDSGITLVALVVTIVVLLILAGITITYVLGDNSIFNQASKAKLETELAKIEERASLIYSEKWLEKVSGNSNNKPTMQEIVKELKNQGDKIEEIVIDGDGIRGILLDRETMTLGFGGTNKIKVTLERNDTSTEYYAVVDGKYYKMHFNDGLVTIDRNSSEVSNEGTKKTLNVSNSDDTIAAATLEESTNTITVTATSKAGTTTVTVTYGSYTKECIITVRDIPITTAMELNSVRARIAAGYTRWLTAVTTPTDALQEFEWTSSNTNIATVDNKGVVTAKKAGTVTITAKTIDGSNKEGSCEVTVVENAVDVATLTEIQTGEKNIVAKDSNGNLITVPIGFKVLTSEGTKVTDGIVIQDEDLNEFVWVPVDSVSTGTTKLADDIRLGRYMDFTTKNASGNYVPKQDADEYDKTINFCPPSYSGKYFQELINDSGNVATKNLKDFVTKTKANGGYYIARYEASEGRNGKVKSQRDKTIKINISQPDASKAAKLMYNENYYVESDLISSYGWDTAIVFIQKYSIDSKYASKITPELSPSNSGKTEDRVCNIFEMATNFFEWTTEHFTEKSIPYTIRGGWCFNGNYCPADRNVLGPSIFSSDRISFRVLLYIK